MKKALILLLAFVMVISAGMGFGAAATTDTNGSTIVQSNDQGTDLTGDEGTDVTGDEGTDVTGDDGTDVTGDDGTDVTGDDGTDVTDEDPEEVTIIIIEKKILYYAESLYGCGYWRHCHGGSGGSGANSGSTSSSAAGGQTVPMQKTGIPILPAVLSTLMIGSGLVYGRLRN